MQMYTGTRLTTAIHRPLFSRLTTAIHRRLLSRFFLGGRGHLYTGYHPYNETK